MRAPLRTLARTVTRAVVIASIAIAAGCVVAPVGPPGYYAPGVVVQPYGYYHGNYGGYYGHYGRGYYGH